MKDGSPFGIADIWENWKDPASGEWVRTFAVLTVAANELVAQIHDRMPAILKSKSYAAGLALSQIRAISSCLTWQSRCGCGRSQSASTHQRTMTRRCSIR